MSREKLVSEEGKERLSDNPIFVGPGFGESKDKSFRGFINNLEDIGHNVVAHEHPKPFRWKYRKSELYKSLDTAKEEARGFYENGMDPEHLENLLDGITLDVYRESEAFIKLVEDNIQRNDRGEIIPIKAVGHSHGGLYVLVAAFLRPDLFSQVVMVNPAGWSGKESKNKPKHIQAVETVNDDRQEKNKREWGKEEIKHTAAIVLRFTLEVFKPTHKKGEDGKRWKNWKDLVSEALHYVARERLFGRAIFEGHGMANMDAGPYTEAIHNYGIQTAIIYDKKDTIFPAKKVEKRVSEYQDSIDATVKTEAHSHYGPVTHPEKFAAMLNKIFQELDRKV